MAVYTGKVVTFNKTPKGFFGFIEYDPKEENMYFNQRGVKPGQNISKGSMVSFSIKTLANNARVAANVTLVPVRKLSMEERTAVEKALSEMLRERGAVDCSLVRLKLKELGINFEEYSADLETFIEKCLSGIFAVRRDVRLGGLNCAQALVWTVSQGIAREALDTLQKDLNEKLENEGCCTMDHFLEILQRCGIESYKIHAETVDEFVDLFLGDGYAVVRDVEMAGKRLPAAILTAKDAEALRSQPSREEDRKDEDRDSDDDLKKQREDTSARDLQTLEELYNRKAYAQFLLSPALERIAPDDLPVNYMEMALTCALRLLNPGEEGTVVLNLFQRELLQCATSGDFIRKWKHSDGFSMEIMRSCAESSLAQFELPRDVGFVARLLNLMGNAPTLNNTYAGLTARFATCENALLPCMYLVRAFVQKSATQIQRCLSEYCQIVKDLKASPNRIYVRHEDRMYGFPRLLQLMQQYLLQDNPMPQNLRTMAVSAFVDTDSMEELAGIIASFVPEPDANERRLVELVNALDSWTEEKFFALLGNNVSEKLLQKSLVLLWEKHPTDAALPEQFLRILSWVVEYDGFICMDELMRYQYTSGYNKITKQIMLLESFGVVWDMLQREPSLYALASYVVNHVLPEVPKNQISQEAEKALAQWEDGSVRFYARINGDHPELTEENASAFVKTFRYFRLDPLHFQALQDRYADWCVPRMLPDRDSPEDLAVTLTKLFTQGAWEAYVRVYMTAMNEGMIIAPLERRAEEFALSMIALRRYSELVAYLLHDNRLTKELRSELLTRAICENFRDNGFTPRAFTLFGEEFTCRDAITMLQDSFAPTRLACITSLIALYEYCGESNKADYLYQIFHSKCESGFQRFYSQYRGRVNGYFGKVHNHYDAIRMAFDTLTPEALVEFLHWTRFIVIPEFKGYKPVHVFSYYYDAIRRDPRNPESWQHFWSHLIKFMDLNAWSICVCEGVLKNVLGCGGYNNGRVAIRDMINRRNEEPLPYNFLPLAFSCLMDSRDQDLLEQVEKLMKDRICRDRLVETNPWYPGYSDIVRQFKDFCLAQYDSTADVVYYDLLTKLGVTLDRGDMEALSQSVADKQYLFTQICRNYLSGADAVEMTRLLFGREWKELSPTEGKLLELLRLLYTDDEILLTEQNLLFPDEQSVSRFKRDCAGILVHYPQKTGLAAFNAECSNLTHKYLVFAYVYRVFYDEDIYDTYAPGYADFGSRREFMAYLSFLSSAYVAQLEKNVTFNFFYKKWRYLKLYINSVLRQGVEADDSGILEIMDAYGHTDLVYGSDYLPFREDVRTFMSMEHLSLEARECYLYGLMVGDTGVCLSLYGNELLGLPPRQRSVCKSLAEKLDYRETNCSIYRLYLDSIREGDFDLVLRVAETVSDFACDALKALENAQDFNRALKLFCDVGLSEKPSEAVNKVMRLPGELFSRHSAMLVPLLCSRQFRFHLYGRLRFAVIHRAQGMELERYRRFTDYLEQKGYEEASCIRHYLDALYACIRGETGKAAEVLARWDIEKGIPSQWQQEAQRIRQYASGGTDRFMPDRSVMDNSQEGKRRTEGFTFPGRLQAVLGAERRNLDAESAMELYDKFRSIRNNPWEKAGTGLTLLCSYPKLDKDSPLKKLLPSREKLALEVGVELTGSGINLSADQQAGVAAELFDQRHSFGDRSCAELLQRLGEQMGHLLRRYLSLQTWVRHGAVFEAYLTENRTVQDFKELRQRILEPCAQLFQPEYPTEQRYDVLRSLSMQFQGLESVYARNVLEGIRRELSRLEDGIRLRIDLVNEENNVTDGYAYFRIENVGRRTVSLAGEEISVTCKVANQPESRVEIRNICDLRSGFVTGGRRWLNMTEDGDRVEVTFSIVLNGKGGERTVICRKTGTLQKAACGSELRVSDSARYAVAYAVPGSEKLYGRDGIKEKLARCIPAGVTVLYGPSRIGKTSLLNWVHRDLAAKQGNVMTVLYGGEHGMGKQRDYVTNFVDRKLPVPYDDDEKMAEYLLVQTIVQGIRRRQRFTAPASANVPAGLLEQVVEILGDEGQYISDRYIGVNQLLRDAGLELWILLDEFQQVVERWKPEKSCDFVEVCQMLSSPDPDSPVNRIKLVVCGSDDLLRHMVLEDDSVWRTAFRTRIAVEPLEKQPFLDMIREEPALYGTNLRYSDAALDALYTYTDGVALYGKEICNSVMADIQRNAAKYAGRNTIYISDIAEATQHLLNRQASELDTKAKEGICEIYDAVTKNLDDDTDKQYLWYMAQWLNDNPDYDGFPERIFTGRKLVRGPEKLHESLSIALARGIIKLKPSAYESGNVYVFRAVFYYFAFLGSASRNLREEKIFAPEEDYAEEAAARDTDPYEFGNLIKVAPNFSQMYTPEQQKALLGAFAATSKETARQAMKEMMGDNIGTNIGVQNNLQINVQNITNTLASFSTGTLTGAELLECVNALPRLEAYYAPDQQLAQSDPALESQRMEHGMEAVANAYADGVRPVIDQAEDSAESDYERCHVREILGLDEKSFEILADVLGDWGYEQLRLTLYLHHMFSQADLQEENAQIDYSPVTIMYCKLLEAMLKEYHCEGYARVFDEMPTNVSVRDRKTGKYNYLSYFDLMMGKYQHRITIGTFTYPLREAAKRQMLGSYFVNKWKEPTTQLWDKHGKAAEDVLQIRNQSAHGQKDHRVTADQQKKLVDLLFHDEGGELIRIRDLVRYTRN